MVAETDRITLTADEQKELRRLMRSPKAEQRQALRASVVWHLAIDGMEQAEVAAKLNITRKTVAKWTWRFVVIRLRGLEDLPRCGAPTHFSVEQRCQVLSIACADPADYGLAGQTCWTLDSLTNVVNSQGVAMSRSAVARTLERNELRPHRMRMWLHSPDPAFRDKVNEVVSLYLAPSPDAVVLCVDEKTGMQATERKNATQRPKPGRPGRYESEYIRHGTQSLLASFDIITGRVVAHCGATRTADDLLAFMEQVASEYRDAKKVVVVWDNLNIHHDGRPQRWKEFNERHGGKFDFRFTPLHASWLNQVEVFFSIVYRRCLKHGSFVSVEDLRAKVLAFIQRWNEKDGHAFDWCFRGYPIQSKAKAVA